MKVIKRILIGIAVLALLFIGALVAIPYFFKDEIVAEVKKAVNENLNATVDFEDVDISMLRRFPNVSLQLENYTVTGIEEFQDIELLAGESFDISVDFWSAWNFGEVPLEVRSVTLNKPDVNILITSSGKANYDILKPVEQTEAVPFEVQLQHYEINDGSLVFDDRQSGNFIKIVDLDHSGDGDFTQDLFDLRTETEIGQLTISSGGIPYLKKANVDLEADFNIDLPNAKYTLIENDLTINSLQLNVDGWVAMPNEDDVEMDMTFSAPQSDFKSLLSLVPNAYIEAYDDVDADGTFNLNGTVKGVYSAAPEKYPSFTVNMGISNGEVQYPDLPLGISNINTNVSVNSPTSNLNDMLVDVSNLKLNIGSNPLEGYFKLRTPMTDPDIDTKIKGRLNLGDLIRAFPMEGITTLNGIIDVDMMARTSMSTIERADYENVNMSGNATIENLDYVAEGTPPVRIDAMRLFFTPQNVQLANFDMKVGKSDVSGSGSIDNVLAYFSPDATMKGSFNVRSNYFNANDWISEEEQVATQSGTTAKSGEGEIFNRFDISLDGSIGRMDYDVYQVEDIVVKGNMTPNRLTASTLSGRIGDSDFSATGSLTNVWNYLFYDEVLSGVLDLRSRYMNLNQFMTEGDTPATGEVVAEKPILIPEGLDIQVNANLDKVLYEDMVLTDVEGGMSVANKAITFDDVTANTLGGQMAIKGGYDTKSPDQPKFDLAMQLQEMDFQQAFSTFNTFEAIAPIGKFIQGKFNTKFSMNSVLGKDLMPDLSTLYADGFLHTLQGTIKGFTPLEKIGNKLDVEAFKNLTLKNTKNWFTVKDGAVKLEEFDHVYEDIAMKIGGFHSLTGNMDYYIRAKIPREKIGKNPLGAAANTGLEYLGKEASRLGLDLSAGEFVNVQINIGGTLSDPQLSFKLLGTEEGGSVKDAIAESVKEEVDKLTDKAKDEAQQRIDAERARAEARAKEEANKLVDSLRNKATSRVDTVAKEATKKVEEEVKEKVGEEAKKKLEEWNPFKKKKGGGG